MMIFLSQADANPQHVTGRLRREVKRDLSSQGRWLYLGRRYDSLLEWQKALGPKFERVSYANELQELAEAWAKPYLNWLTQWGRQNDVLEWWSSHIAGRNTMVDSLYHQICYLKIALMFSLSRDTPTLIVAEDPALLKTLSEYPALKHRTKRIAIGRAILNQFLWGFRVVVSWRRYLLEAFLELRDARFTRRGHSTVTPHTDRPRILIHTCIDETYFGEDGKPNDRYFSVLPDELRQRGYEVVILPWLYQIRRSRREALKWFREHPGEYLIPEDFYSMGDYLWSAGIVLRQAWLLKGRHEFQGLDVSRLVREACRRQGGHIGVTRFIRYFRLIEKLAERGFKFSIFIDMFENQFTEKPQVMGFRRWMPEVRTVGFQHYAGIERLLLSKFTTDEEAGFAPHPDVIVCNSPLTRGQLEEAGFPAHKLRIGPSLRYLYFSNQKFLDRVPKKNTALVVLALDRQATVELLLKLRKAFPGDEGIRFWVKPHPMMSPKALSHLLKLIPLGGHMTLVDGSFEKWLSQAACAISLSSTSALEIALAGVPVVLVGRETDFDLNPLAWFPEFDRPVCDPEQLRVQVLRKCRLSLAEREPLKDWARRMRAEAFSLPTEAAISAFLKPKWNDSVSLREKELVGVGK